MARDSTRVALVGTGFIADLHAEAIREIEGSNLVGVVDTDVDRARGFARRHGLARAHGRLPDLVAECEPAVVHVLTPPPTHAEIASELLRADCDVLVEKPLALSESTASRLAELAAERGRRLGVNHSQLFHPSFVELEARISAGEIGPVEHVASLATLPLRQLSARQYRHWMFQHPQNILFEAGPHPFSLIHRLLGEVEHVTCSCPVTRFLDDELPFYPTWQIQLTSQRGTASVLLTFGAQNLESRLLVFGPDGTFDVDLARGYLTRAEKTKWPEFWDIRVNARTNAKRLSRQGGRTARNYISALLGFRPRSDVFYQSMRGSILAFHSAVREGRELPCSGRDGAAVVEYCEQTWEAKKAFGQSPAPPRYGVDAVPGPAEIAVLGATGFIGRHVVERLVARGNKLRVLVRPGSYVPARLRRADIELVEGSLGDASSFERLVSGCHSVIHLATGVGDDWEGSKRGAVDGTVALANACVSAGVARFVFVSSIAALYLGDPRRVDDSTPPDPKPLRRSIYSRAKIAAELELARLQVDAGLPLIVVRPGLVVGRGGPTRHGGTGYWPRNNHCLGWGAGNVPLPFVLADDVADALVLAIDNDAAIGQQFNLAGDVRLTAREYVAELARISRRPIRFHAQSLPVMQLVDIGKWLIKLMIRKPGNVFPSYRDLKSRRLAAELVTDRAREILGWKPEADRERFVERGLVEPLEVEA